MKWNAQRSSLFALFDLLTALDHMRHGFEVADVAQRIARGGDQLCKRARLEAAQFILAPQHRRRIQRCRAARLARGHPVCDPIGALEGIEPLWYDPADRTEERQAWKEGGN